MTVGSLAAGLEAVEAGGTMVVEQPTADHLAAADCSLYTVGNLEDRHYAFAFPKGLTCT